MLTTVKRRQSEYIQTIIAALSNERFKRALIGVSPDSEIPNEANLSHDGRKWTAMLDECGASVTELLKGKRLSAATRAQNTRIAGQARA